MDQILQMVFTTVSKTETSPLQRPPETCCTTSSFSPFRRTLNVRLQRSDFFSFFAVRFQQSSKFNEKKKKKRKSHGSLRGGNFNLREHEGGSRSRERLILVTFFNFPTRSSFRQIDSRQNLRNRTGGHWWTRVPRLSSESSRELVQGTLRWPSRGGDVIGSRDTV